MRTTSDCVSAFSLLLEKRPGYLKSIKGKRFLVVAVAVEKLITFFLCTHRVHHLWANRIPAEANFASFFNYLSFIFYFSQFKYYESQTLKCVE